MIPILKVAVVVMGILIVAGLAVIGVKIFQKSNELAESLSIEAVDAPVAGPTPFSTSIEQLGLDPGVRLISMDVEGEKLVLRVRDDTSGGERVVIIDLNSGTVRGEIALPSPLR
ncbi:MAG: hypothetical protein V3T62_03490 [Alphaproteobacteria bacterium]